METKCPYCLRVPTANLSCSRCETPYCSSDCQENDWGYHKRYCSSHKTYEENKKILNEQIATPLTGLALANFEFIKEIGSGNFTAIELVEHKDTGKLYALKIIDKIKMTKVHKEGDVLAEKHSLLQLSSSHYIVRIFSTFKEPNLLYILQEFIRGSELWNHCQYFGLCSDVLSRYYMLQILNGIKEMHSKNIIHRDIKPENIMVCNKENNIRFVDLGSSLDLDHPEVRPKIGPELKGRVHEFFVGTAQYMAPECANNKGAGKPCDIWSAGCLFYHLYTGWPPFVGATEYLVFLKSTKIEYTFAETIPEDIKIMIKTMIQEIPTNRPTVENVIENKAFDCVRHLNKKPLVPLADLALISLKDYYVKNAGVLRVRPENYDQAENEIKAALEESKKILNSEQQNKLEKILRLFSLQLKSVLLENEFALIN